MKRSTMPARKTPLQSRSLLRRRMPLASNPAPMLRSSIVKVSAKRRHANSQYSQLRRQFLADHPQCQVCGAVATDVHHKRGRVGALLLDVTHWCALCRICHRYVTEHPAGAYESGISERRVS